MLFKFFNSLTFYLSLQLVWQITVSCIENQPAVTVNLGEHLHLTVGDYYLSKKKQDACEVSHTTTMSYDKDSGSVIPKRYSLLFVFFKLNMTIGSLFGI